MTPTRSRLTFAWLVVAPTLLATPLPTTAAPAETPEAFVRRVYVLYHPGGPGVSTERPAGTPFYTEALLDAFAKDSELLHGEVGAIDADPICACQDFGKVRVTKVAITGAGADTVSARVNFTNLRYRETVILTLARTPAGWRIADVGSKDMKSVMAALQDEIAHPTPAEPPDESTHVAPKL